jgi:TonB-dependent receptor
MRIAKLSIATIFFTTSLVLHAQVVPSDTTRKEKNIDAIVIKGNRDQKTETAILSDMKKAVIQKQAIGAEEISRKGISNVEQGLTKITGITAVKGKGLFVRGLEERYNTLLINNLGSPSNNPFQKIIALKQFPTDVVGKLNVYKTFTSDLYADFAGATFDIETLTYEKAFTKIEFGIGFNSVSTFKNDFKINPNANSFDGYLGLNDQDRKLPQEVDGYKPGSYIFSKEQSKNSFGEGWNVNSVKSLPNTSIGFTTAQKINLGNNKSLGFLFSLNQSDSYEFHDGEKNQFRFNGNEIDYNNFLNRKEYTYTTESSVLLGLGYKTRSTKVNFNGIFLQNSENLVQDFRGFRNGQQNQQEFIRANQQDISRFTDLQLSASHNINDRNEIKAGASWVNNNYQQPDRKIFYGQITPNSDQINLSYGGNNLIRQYFDVQGKNYLSAYAEYTLKLGEKGDKKEYPLQLNLGYNGFVDVRNTSYRFIFSALGNNPVGSVNINIDNPQSTFNQSLLNDEFHFREGSTSEYRNNLYQFVNAGYLTTNYKPSESWDIIAGARVENSINITRFKYLGSINVPFESITKDKVFVLPSLAVKKTINSKSNLRFAASKTITRPILIEYMPITYINPDNENIFGNKNLNNSENYNLDLKYEWFPTRTEMMAINLFGKKIDNAIERSYTASGNSNGQTITFYNAKSANLLGVEIEGILDLKRISDNLDNFTFGANATFMYTNVNRSEEQSNETDAEANRKRTLQGAAPFTINADIKYERKNENKLTQTISLVYNVSGKKIYGVGFSKLDNVYELPFHQLDLIYSQELSKNWNIKVGVKNLLNSNYRLQMGDRSLVGLNANISSLNLENYKVGTTLNFTAGYTF